MKKHRMLLPAVIAFGGMFAGFTANAQLFTYTASSTTSTAASTSETTTSSMSSALSSSSPSVLATGTMSSTPIVTPIFTSTPIGPQTSPGFIQFNSITITNVSSLNIPPSLTAADPASCEMFPTADSPLSDGVAIACPTNTMTGSTTSTITVQLAATTDLLLSDRTAAVIGNITAGDIVNAFGYYDGAGTLDATIVRDLSKPAGAASAASGPTIASLQAQLNSLQNLIAQIIQEIQTSMNGAPMIPASTTTSTASGPLLPVSSSIPIATSSNATGTIIY